MDETQWQSKAAGVEGEIGGVSVLLHQSRAPAAVMEGVETRRLATAAVDEDAGEAEAEESRDPSAPQMEDRSAISRVLACRAR
jgi:hypothetical protein